MNNKKKSNGGKSVFRRTIENRGFYIALFSLVLIVGFSIYAGRMGLGGEKRDVSFDDEAWQSAVKESNIMITEDKSDTDKEDGKAVSDTESVETPGKSAEKTNNEGDDAVVQDETSEAAVETVAEGDGRLSMSLPCTGKIIAACSIDDLVYSSTMDDWRTHNGIDIAAKIGDPVKAAADGTVSQVYEDELLGVVVVVDHGGGVSSLYGNLQSYDFIRTGTAVKSGDIIGGVGETGALEKDSEAHLHFEVHKDGEYCNPTDYLGA